MENRCVYVTDEAMQQRLTGWPVLETVAAGCRLIAGVDVEGVLHGDSVSYIRAPYWTGLRALAADRHNAGVLFGLRGDGTCLLAKDPFAGWSDDRLFPRTKTDNRDYTFLHHFVHSLTGVVQIAATGSMFLALDGAGRVHALVYVGLSYSGPVSPYTYDWLSQLAREVSGWEGVRQILLAEPELIVAQKHDGELLIAGYANDLYGTFGRSRLASLRDRKLTDACGYYGGESMHFAFLDDEGRLISLRYPETEDRFLQIEGLGHTFLALRRDGRVVCFQDGFEEITAFWPPMRQISLGRRRTGVYDDLFLAGLPARPSGSN